MSFFLPLYYKSSSRQWVKSYGQIWNKYSCLPSAVVTGHSTREAILGSDRGSTGKGQPDTWIGIKGGGPDDIFGCLDIGKWIQCKTSPYQGLEGIIASLFHHFQCPCLMVCLPLTHSVPELVYWSNRVTEMTALLWDCYERCRFFFFSLEEHALL